MGGQHNGTTRYQPDGSDSASRRPPPGSQLYRRHDWRWHFRGERHSAVSGSRRPVDQIGEPPMNGYERFLENPTQAWTERLAPTGASKEIQETIRQAQPNPGHHALVQLWKRRACCGI